jgi:DNA-binding NtrC family response regulator
MAGSRSIAPAVLVADTPPAQAVIRRLLHGRARVVGAATLSDALAALAGADLVVCGVHFDESRMFELLAAVHARSPGVPVVCVHTDVGDAVLATTIGNVEVTCRALGAAAFVDQAGRIGAVGVAQAEAELQETLAAHLPRGLVPQ